MPSPAVLFRSTRVRASDPPSRLFGVARRPLLQPSLGGRLSRPPLLLSSKTSKMPAPGRRYRQAGAVIARGRPSRLLRLAPSREAAVSPAPWAYVDVRGRGVKPPSSYLERPSRPPLPSRPRRARCPPPGDQLPLSPSGAAVPLAPRNAPLESKIRNPKSKITRGVCSAARRPTHPPSFAPAKRAGIMALRTAEASLWGGVCRSIQCRRSSVG